MREAEPALRLSARAAPASAPPLAVPTSRAIPAFAPPAHAREPHLVVCAETDTYRRVDGVWLHASMQLETVMLASFEKGWSGGLSQ